MKYQVMCVQADSKIRASAVSIRTMSYAHVYMDIYGSRHTDQYLQAFEIAFWF